MIIIYRKDTVVNKYKKAGSISPVIKELPIIAVSKIFEKNSRNFQKVKLGFAAHQQLFTAFTLYLQLFT